MNFIIRDLFYLREENKQNRRSRPKSESSIHKKRIRFIELHHRVEILKIEIL